MVDLVFAGDAVSHHEAFGRPGIAPTWTSSEKDLVVTALGPSRLCATLGHGIVNEVYWPATGMPQVRDLGFIVAGAGRWTEVKREKRYALSTPAPWLPREGVYSLSTSSRDAPRRAP